MTARTSPGVVAEPRCQNFQALEERCSRPAGVGFGVGSGHYGELFQGEILDEQGALCRCLVTLPCSAFYARAEFTLSPGGVRVEPVGKVKARRAAEMMLAQFDLQRIGGTLVLESNIPEGKGNGSSSADCVAAARAVADALGHSVSPEEVAYLVVKAESASDSVMFDNPVLFAHREGRVLEKFGRPLPPMEVVGLDAEPSRCIDTLAHPLATYTSGERQLFRLLLDGLRKAIWSQDFRSLSEIAHVSAMVNQRFLPNALFQDLQAVSKEIGALGVSVAHSGTAICVLLHARDPRLQHKVEKLQKKLSANGIDNFHRFSTA